MSVEYDQNTTVAKQQDETTEESQPQQQEVTDTANICEQVDSLPDTHETYNVVIRRPGTVTGKQSRCSKLINKLENQVGKSENRFWYYATSESCMTSGSEVTLVVRLNIEALKYVSQCHVCKSL